MTHIEERWIEREEGQKNYMRIWHTDLPKKAVVLILTGMAEHIRRYDDFAHFLNKEGYLVVGSDHRGHGQTALKNGKLGHLEPGDFRRIVQDQKYYVDCIRKEHPDLPIYMVCHSFGSLVGQKFIQKFSDDIDGIVLLGSLKQAKPKAMLGNAMICPISLLTGEKYNSKLANDFLFYDFNKGLEEEGSDYAWICSDPEVVKKYDKDPLCGFEVSNSFIHELSSMTLQLYNTVELNQIRKDLPILIISGGADPLNERGKRVLELYLQYLHLGIHSVTLRLHDKMRHEVLNEVEKEKVYQQILEFLRSNKKNK